MKMWTTIFFILLLLPVGGCNDGPAERAGEKLDAQVAEARKQVEELQGQIKDYRQEIDKGRKEMAELEQQLHAARMEFEQARQERQQILQQMEPPREGRTAPAPAGKPVQ